MADEFEEQLLYCHVCKKELPAIYFHAAKNMANGKHSKCRDCKRQAEELRKWGYTYEELVQIFGDKCNICGEVENIKDWRSTLPHRLCVDHDHNCCKYGCKWCIRGLLCRGCNYLLGKLEGKTGWLEVASEYLTIEPGIFTYSDEEGESDRRL